MRETGTVDWMNKPTLNYKHTKSVASSVGSEGARPARIPWPTIEVMVNQEVFKRVRGTLDGYDAIQAGVYDLKL